MPGNPPIDPLPTPPMPPWETMPFTTTQGLIAIAKDFWSNGIKIQGDIEEVTETDDFNATVNNGAADQEILFANITTNIYNWSISNDGDGDLTYKFDDTGNPSHTIKAAEVHDWEGLKGTKIYVSNSSGAGIALRIQVSGR